MPELPEVETTRRGIAPLIDGMIIERVIVRNRNLRWPVPEQLEARVAGQRVRSVTRRAKYLLIELDTSELIVHLGMSGSLRFLTAVAPPGPHDHVDWVFASGTLRLNDPRRFGCVLLSARALEHKLIAGLGPEPLEGDFTLEYLRRACAGRKVAIKQLLMNAHVVVGVGNIYANEALFRAGIHPRRPAGRIARPRLQRLLDAVRAVLEESIAEGGTTLRDFVGSDGRPGYFRIALNVYERAGHPCPRCKAPIRRIVQGQRATYYCPSCQR
ncbi:MAG TPA: bifunctional DNA-formamidopyrimidine glycosylase/DNA-(apurinic or apyrimidinic site) lyase [Gammaproteobacteria bacterium]|nr:bifunctional DNA-formamidopyrimidine glycosylase/DNA-(apurinic or apyrimidinic site) lyase [Gammaproteobacteria bacterium]